MTAPLRWTPGCLEVLDQARLPHQERWLPCRTADEVAGVELFLCCEESDYITGQTINVDGGFEMD